MNDGEHVSEAVMLDLLTGRLDAGAAAEAEAHLGTACERCAEAREFAERILAAAAEDLEEPPARTLSRARALFGTHRKPGLAQRVREFVATLISPPAPAFAGVRSVTDAVPLAFSAGPYLVELALDRNGGDAIRSLRSRVVVSDTGLGAPGIARLFRGTRPLTETVVNDLGEGVFRDVPKTADRLILYVEGARLVIRL